MAFDLAILVDIAIILLLAKVFGEIAERMKFPVLFGEIIAGLAIGALAIVKPTEFMNEIAGIGILFLFFMLGLTLKITDIRKEFKSNFLITMGGTFTSFTIGFLFGYFIFADATKGLFVGIAVMSTSTAIALKMLHDAGELNTKIFNLASAASRVDDVIAVLMIAVLTSVMLMGPKMEAVLLSVAAVLVIFLLLEKWAAAAIGRALGAFRQLRDEHMLVATALVAIFIVSYLVQGLGTGSVIGAFLAGYALSKSKLTDEEILPKMKTIGHGFFIPIFFTYAAVSADIGSAAGWMGAVAVLFVLAMAAKFAGTAVFAWWEGHKGRELALLSSAMMPRGEYAIAIAYIALLSQFIDRQLYSIIIIFTLLTIIATPIAFKILKKMAY